MKFTLLGDSFLSLKTVHLGRLVIDAKNPYEDFWPQTETALLPHEYEERTFDGLVISLRGAKSRELRAKVSQWISGHVSSEESSRGQLSAHQAKVYKLLQPNVVFRRLCSDITAREWMEERLQYFPIFLIDTLITVTHATMGHDQSQSKNVGGSFAVPVTLAATQGIPVPGLTDVLDVHLHAGVKTETGGSFSFSTPGERVIGVRYRKVKFRLFSSKKVDNSFLENNSNRWKTFVGTTRSSDSDDLLEADVEAIDDLDDLELESSTEILNTEDESIVFVE